MDTAEQKRGVGRRKASTRPKAAEPPKTKRQRPGEAPRLSEKIARGVIEQSEDGIVITDEQGMIVAWNRGQERITGRKRKEMVGQPLWRALFQAAPLEQQTPAVLEALRTKTLVFLKSGKADSLKRLLETEMQRPDGTCVYVQTIISPIRTAAGWMSMSVTRDITDRKHLEEALRKSEDEYRFLLSSTSDFIARSDRNGIVVFATDASRRFHGYEPDEIINTPTFERIHPADRDQIRDQLKRVIETGAEGRGEYRLKCKNGEYMWVEATGRRVFNTAGEPEVIAVLRDIAARKQLEEALRESEVKHRIVANNTYDWEFWQDPQGNVVYTSPSCERISGYTPDEFRADPTLLVRVIHPDDRQISEDYQHKLQLGPLSDQVEFRIIRKDGQIGWIGQVCQPVFDGQGAYLGLRGSNRDITERKRVQEALAAANTLFEKALCGLRAAVVVIDATAQIILFGNPAVETVLGYPLEEVVGRNIEVLHGNRAMCKAFDRQLLLELDRSGHFDAEFQMKRKDGTLFPAEHTVTEIRNSAGQRTHLVGIVRDVTERKQAEAALRESEERYRSLFQASLDAMFLTAPDGRIFSANPAACQMFGYTEEEFQRLGREAVVDATDPRLLSALEERARTGRFRGELTLVRKGGARFPGEVSTALFTNRDGGRTSLVVRDITERKEAESKLTESAEQLRALGQYLRMTREEERARIAREIHDDLGQALTALKMDLASLSKQLPVHLRPLAATLSGSVDDIMRTVRSVASQLRPSLLDDLGLAAALEWQAEGFQKRTGIACKLDLPEESLTFSRDVTTAVFRIVQEAMTNVACHSKATCIHILLETRLGRLDLTVQDDGIGITEKQLNDRHAFGLIGMRERALALDGTLEIESAASSGTTIRVSIPLVGKPVEGRTS